MELSATTLPVIIINALRRQNIRTVEELRGLSEEQLLSIRTIGAVKVHIIEEFLAGNYEPEEPVAQKSQKRSLYQCYNARCRNQELKCAKGHEFPFTAITQLIRGDPLEFSCCQDCEDYDEMGGPVAAADRGWIN